MRKSTRFLLMAALTAVAIPVHAAAAPPRLTRYPTGVVHAGDTIELEWSKPSREVKELEILLAVGEDQQFTIRVSPELERYRNHWTWKVPDLSAEHARLCVRYGEGPDERLSVPTPEFRIVSRHETRAGTAPKLHTAWLLTPAQTLDWWDEADAYPTSMPMPSMSGEPTLAPVSATIRSFIAPSRSKDAEAQLDTPLFFPKGEVPASPNTPSQSFAAVPQFLPLRE
jgi:hypothetical protein